MSKLSWVQLFLVGLVFICSGFVGSGTDFGGSVLALPLLLMIDNRQLIYLPIISVMLLFFSNLTIWQNNRKLERSNPARPGTGDSVDCYLRRIQPIMIGPQLTGRIGKL